MRSGDVMAMMVIGATAVFGIAVQKGLQAAHDSAKNDLVEVWNYSEDSPLDSEARFELRDRIRSQVRDQVRRQVREGLHVHNQQWSSGDWDEMSPEERAEFEAAMREFSLEMEEFGAEMEELGREFEDMNFDFRFDLDGLDLNLDGLDLNLDGLAIELEGLHLDLEELEAELEQLEGDGVIELHDARGKKKRKIIIRPPRRGSGGN